MLPVPRRILHMSGLNMSRPLLRRRSYGYAKWMEVRYDKRTGLLVKVTLIHKTEAERSQKRYGTHHCGDFCGAIYNLALNPQMVLYMYIHRISNKRYLYLFRTPYAHCWWRRSVGPRLDIILNRMSSSKDPTLLPSMQTCRHMVHFLSNAESSNWEDLGELGWSACPHLNILDLVDPWGLPVAADGLLLCIQNCILHLDTMFV